MMPVGASRKLASADRLRFQRLLSHLSARFSNLSSADLDREVPGALRRMTRLVGVESATLLAFAERGGADRCWSTEAEMPARLPWLTAQLRRGKSVRIRRLAQLPRDAVVDRATCRALGVSSVVAVPLRAGGRLVGGLTLATSDGERRWSRELMDQLHLFGEAVGHALAAATARRETGRLRQQLAHIGRVSALGELAASLAHELNQPLAAILNNAEVAQAHLAAAVVDVPELRAIVNDIVADDKRATEIIRRLRGLLNKGQLDHAPLDVNDFVNEVAELARHDAGRRNVPVALALGADLPGVRGDRIQLQQVVLNMILNGLEAMGCGDGKPHALTIRTSAADRTAVTVAVEDTGPGIALGLDRLAEPLYSTKATGLGMGLAISRTIIDAHGGRLSATNNAGGGATFAFTLPAERAPS